MSLAEIKEAVTALSPEELAELAAFVQERDDAAWDRRIDADFADGGRFTSPMFWKWSVRILKRVRLRNCRDRESAAAFLEMLR